MQFIDIVIIFTSIVSCTSLAFVLYMHSQLDRIQDILESIQEELKAEKAESPDEDRWLNWKKAFSVNERKRT